MEYNLSPLTHGRGHARQELRKETRWRPSGASNNSCDNKKDLHRAGQEEGAKVMKMKATMGIVEEVLLVHRQAGTVCRLSRTIR